MKIKLEYKPVECEECNIVCFYRTGIERHQRGTWTEGAIATGMSKKYPGHIAAYCEKHAAKFFER